MRAARPLDAQLKPNRGRRLLVENNRHDVELLAQRHSEVALKFILVVILTPSREEPDLGWAYHPEADGGSVKLADFVQFVGAVKGVGSFWAVLDEPPPGTIKRHPVS